MSGASRLGKPRSTFQSRRVGEETMEVDLVGINGDEVVVVEVKSKLTVMMCGITSTRWRTSNASFSATPTTASSVR
jgi:Holliday junction resolvase-like predicted endonuclease